MAFNYLNQDYPGLKEYIKNNRGRYLSHIDSTPIYAHPVDKWILSTLNTAPVKAALNKAVDGIVSFQFGHVLVQGITIDQRSFPDLYEVLSHCSRTLNIPIPHAVAHHDPSLFNAYTAGTDEYAFINISSALCQFFTKEEACFVIGHECGHIASGHMLYHTLASVVMNAMLGRLGIVVGLIRSVASIPLAAWARRSEITADRAGLLCCGDISVAERALLRLTAGFADLKRVDIDDYLQKTKQIESFHKLSKFHELFATHPLIPKRIEALRLFAESELYYKLSRKPRPAGKALLSQEALNRNVSLIVQP